MRKCVWGTKPFCDRGLAALGTFRRGTSSWAGRLNAVKVGGSISKRHCTAGMTLHGLALTVTATVLLISSQTVNGVQQTDQRLHCCMHALHHHSPAWSPTLEQSMASKRVSSPKLLPAAHRATPSPPCSTNRRAPEPAAAACWYCCTVAARAACAERLRRLRSAAVPSAFSC